MADDNDPFADLAEPLPKPRRAVPRSPTTYDPDTAMDLVSKYESGDRNVPNYRYDPTHTAQGHYQITNTNWRNYGPRAGVNVNQYPSAMAAPKEAQKSVAKLMYGERGFQDWAPYNPQLRRAIGRGEQPQKPAADPFADLAEDSGQTPPPTKQNVSTPAVQTATTPAGQSRQPSVPIQQGLKTLGTSRTIPKGLMLPKGQRNAGPSGMPILPTPQQSQTPANVPLDLPEVNKVYSRLPSEMVQAANTPAANERERVRQQVQQDRAGRIGAYGAPTRAGVANLLKHPISSFTGLAQPEEQNVQNEVQQQIDATRATRRPEVEALTKTYRGLIHQAAQTGQLGPDVQQWANEVVGQSAGLGEYAAAGVRGLSPITAITAQLLGRRKMDADTIALHSAAIAQAAEEEGANRSDASKLAQHTISGLIQSAPEAGAMALGVPPIAAFAGGGAIRAFGRGESPTQIAEAASTNALQAAPFELPVSQTLGGVKGALARGAEVGAGTTALGLAQGQTFPEALSSGAQMGVMAGAPEVGREAPRRAAIRERLSGLAEAAGPRGVTDVVNRLVSSTNLPRDVAQRMVDDATGIIGRGEKLSDYNLPKDYEHEWTVLSNMLEPISEGGPRGEPSERQIEPQPNVAAQPEAAQPLTEAEKNAQFSQLLAAQPALKEQAAQTQTAQTAQPTQVAKPEYPENIAAARERIGAMENPFADLAEPTKPEPTSTLKLSGGFADPNAPNRVAQPKLMGLGEPNPLNPQESVIDGVKYSLKTQAMQPNELYLDIESAQRGKGNASRVLDKILDAAKEQGIDIVGLPKAFGRGGLSTEQLKQWYARHGFERYRGDLIIKRAEVPESTPTSQTPEANVREGAQPDISKTTEPVAPQNEQLDNLRDQIANSRSKDELKGVIGALESAQKKISGQMNALQIGTPEFQERHQALWDQWKQASELIKSAHNAHIGLNEEGINNASDRIRRVANQMATRQAEAAKPTTELGPRQLTAGETPESKRGGPTVADAAKVALAPPDSVIAQLNFGKEQPIDTKRGVYTTRTARGREYKFDLHVYKLADGRERLVLSAGDPTELVDAGAIVRPVKDGVVVETIHGGETGFKNLGGVLARQIKSRYGRVIPETEAPLSPAGRKATEKLARREPPVAPEVPVSEQPKSAGEKQTWEMTQKEFIDDRVTPEAQRARKKSIGNLTLKEWQSQNHERFVRQAASEGKPVPPEVLADYPDLKRSAEVAEPKSETKPTSRFAGKSQEELETMRQMYEDAISLKESKNEKVPDAYRSGLNEVRTLLAGGNPATEIVTDSSYYGHPQGVPTPEADNLVPIKVSAKTDFSWRLKDIRATINELQQKIGTAQTGKTKADKAYRASHQFQEDQMRVEDLRKTEQYLYKLQDEAAKLSPQSPESETKPVEPVSEPVAGERPTTTWSVVYKSGKGEAARGFKTKEAADEYIKKQQTPWDFKARSRTERAVPKAETSGRVSDVAASRSIDNPTREQRVNLPNGESVTVHSYDPREGGKPISESEALARANKTTNLKEWQERKVAELQAKYPKASVEITAEGVEARGRNGKVLASESRVSEPVETKPETKPENAKIAAARKRLAKGSSTFNSGLDPQQIADFVIVHGYDLYQTGKTKFEDWSKAMRDIYGEKIEPHLATAWDGIQKAIGVKEPESAAPPPSETANVAGEREPSTTSARKAQMAEDRAALDLPELPEAERKSWQKSLDEAKPEDANRLADEVIEKPRPLNDSETASIVVRAQQVKNELGDIRGQLSDAKGADVERLSRESKALQDEFNKLTTAAKKSGTEKGRALAAQKLTINEDYDLTTLNQRRAEAKGAELTKAEEEKNVAKDKRITDLEKQIADLQAKQKVPDTDKFIREQQLKIRQQGRARTVEGLKAERADLKTQFAQAWAKTKPKSTTLSMGGLGDLDPKAIAELSQISVKLARNYIEDGITKSADLVDAVHNHLKDVADDLTKRDVSDLISGYGRTKNATTDPVERKLNELKSILAAQSGKADVLEEGIRPLRRGQQREKPTEDQRRALRELNEAMREKGPELAQRPQNVEREQATPLDKSKTTVRNRIEQLKGWIESGKKEVEGRSRIIPDAELKQLQAERQGLERAAKLLDDPEADQKAVERRLAEINKSISGLKSNIQSGRVESQLKEGQSSRWSPEIGAAERERAVLQRVVSDMRAEGVRQSRNVPQEKAPFYGAEMSWADFEKEARKTLAQQKSARKRIEGQIQEYQRRRTEQDFGPRPKKEAPKYDKQIQDLQEQLGREKLGFERDLKQYERARRTKAEKAADLLVEWGRAAKLSYLSTIGKLSSAASGRMVMSPIENLVGEVPHRLFPELSKRATTEGGGFSKAAEVAALWKSGRFKQVLNQITKGSSNLDVLYGPRSKMLDKEMSGTGVLGAPGRAHGALKEYPRQAEFDRQFVNVLRNYEKAGKDITDPNVQLAGRMEAFNAAERARFQQRNFISDEFNSAMARWEKRGGAAKVGAKIGKFVFPITRVPVNVVGETMNYSFGLPRAVAEHSWRTMRGTMKDMTPEQSDSLMRAYKKGGVGLAMMAYAFLNPKQFGGYYQKGEKRDPNEPQVGEVMFFGQRIPKWATHVPIIEAAQLAATVRRVFDATREKKGMAEATVGGATAGAKGLAEGVPFYEAPARFFTGQEGTRGVATAAGEQVRGMIPGFVQEGAAAIDRKNGKPVKRVPDSKASFGERFGQTVELGIPGLRKNVPEKVEKTSAADRISPYANQVRSGRMDGDKLQQLVDKGTISEKEKSEILKQGAMTVQQSGFNEKKPKDAMQTFDSRMTPTQREQVREIMNKKVWSLLHSDTEHEDARGRARRLQEIQKFIDKHGLEPTNPRGQKDTRGVSGMRQRVQSAFA